jgi:hypothetical protein
MPPTLFLLSPASLNGLRAKQLISPRAKFDAAVRYRSPEGVAIGDAFAFMSALYFRGKLAYAKHFSVASEVIGGAGIYVITSGYGLVPHDWPLTEERMQRMRKIDVDVSSRSYTKPLREHAGALATMLEPDARVVLLGSVATGKYVDVLLPILGKHLRFPTAFAGLGDMARGGLMLRAVRADRELEYTTLDAPRHRGPGGSGKMPSL